MFARSSRCLRGADVEYEEDGLFFCLAEGLYAGAVALGRHVPVDRPDIVAVLVGANIVEFQARSLEDGVEVTLHLAIDSLADLYLVVT